MAKQSWELAATSSEWREIVQKFQQRIQTGQEVLNNMEAIQLREWSEELQVLALSIRPQDQTTLLTLSEQSRARREWIDKQITSWCHSKLWAPLILAKEIKASPTHSCSTRTNWAFLSLEDQWELQHSNTRWITSQDFLEATCRWLEAGKAFQVKVMALRRPIRGDLEAWVLIIMEAPVDWGQEPLHKRDQQVQTPRLIKR